MIVTHKIPYREGELRLGWASWDDGSLTERSVKYAYKDSSGKVSRGAPEIATAVLVDMVAFAAKHGHFRFAPETNTSATGSSRRQLAEELRSISNALDVVERLSQDFPWADFASAARDLTSRRDELDDAMRRARKAKE